MESISIKQGKTKKKSVDWPGWREFSRKHAKEGEKRVKNTQETVRCHWNTIEPYNPRDEEYEHALNEIVRIQGHSSAKKERGV